MLAIARALMSRPKLILFDEPSLGLSPMVVDVVMSNIRDMRRQGLSVLLVEQNATLALSYADQAYVLESGNITLQGAGSELMGSELVRRAYLGM